jgi:hypothetical protein
MNNPRVSEEFSFANESNDCSVRATAIALDKPYRSIHEAFKKHGRRWGKGVTVTTLMATLRDLTGGDLKIVASSVIRKKTLSTFVRENPRGRYLIIKSRHAFTVIDGVAYDAHPSACTSRSIVKFAFKIGD